MEGQLKSGETVLLHAGGSGGRTAGIQMACEAGATVFITAGSDTKLERCREFGASLAVNYKTHDFFKAVMDATDGKGVDLILDPVGGAYLNRNLRNLSERGRLFHIGLLGGAKAEIDLGLLLGKSLRIIGPIPKALPTVKWLKAQGSGRKEKVYFPKMDRILCPLIHALLGDLQIEIVKGEISVNR